MKHRIKLRDTKNHQTKEVSVSIKPPKKMGRPVKLFPDYKKSKEAQKIYKWFLEKLMNHIPSELSLERRLEILFLAQQRRIATAYVVTHIEKMPGLVIQEDGQFRWPLVLEAKFQQGTPIFVRMDSKMPDRIDIEKASVPGLMFSLTRAEYLSILPNIGEITGCNNLLDPSTLSDEL